VTFFVHRSLVLPDEAFFGRRNEVKVAAKEVAKSVAKMDVFYLEFTDYLEFYFSNILVEVSMRNDFITSPETG
jgi:hypothetical protein